jgi:hypothetical protein
LVLGTAGIETAAAAEHGLLDLRRDDRSDLSQVLTDLVDLEHGAHEELQVALQLAGGGSGLGVNLAAEAGADEVVDRDVIGALAVAVDAAVALLQPVGVPGDLVMNQVGAVVLQVDAFGGGVGREQDAHRRFRGCGLEGGLDTLALPGVHATVEDHQAVLGG